MTHPNKDILIALANGEEIEWRYKEERWQLLLQPAGLWAALVLGPEYYPDYSFRIKPKKVMIRHAKYKDGTTMFVFSKNFSNLEDKSTQEAETSDELIWLDEWHESSFSPAGSND